MSIGRGVMVGLASIEAMGAGIIATLDGVRADGALRFLISSDTEYLGMPEPEVSVRGVSGLSYVVLPDRAGSSGDEMEVSMHALGLRKPAELEVEITRLAEFDHRHDDLEVASGEGPGTSGSPSDPRPACRSCPPTPWASVRVADARLTADLCAPPRRCAGR